MTIEVLTALCICSEFLAPKYFAATTFAPTEIPMNRLTKRFISEPVEPTAAREVSPANLPITATSAA